MSKRKYTHVTGQMVYDMRAMRSKGAKLKDIAEALGCSKTAVSTYTSAVGIYKDVKPWGYPEHDDDGTCVHLTPEMLEYLTAISKHTSMSVEDAVGTGLWYFLDALTDNPKPNTSEAYSKLMEGAKYDYAQNRANINPSPEPEPEPEPAHKPGRFAQLLAFLKSPAGV